MHNIEYFDYPEDCDRAAVEFELDNYVAKTEEYEDYCGLPNPIRWDYAKPRKSRRAARDYIEQQDTNNYDQIAVRYRCGGQAGFAKKQSKTLDELLEREKAAENGLEKLLSSISVQKRKAEFIGCPGCGSKLRRVVLKGETCPLCGTDLRSETALERLESSQRKLEEIRNKINALREKEREANTQAGGGEIRWLIKIEYHV